MTCLWSQGLTHWQDQIRTPHLFDLGRIMMPIPEPGWLQCSEVFTVKMHALGHIQAAPGLLLTGWLLVAVFVVLTNVSRHC